MAVIFFICVAIVAYHLILYPSVLVLLGSLIGRSRDRRPSLSGEELPSVTVLVTCCNEGQVMAEKVENLKQQDYPAEKMEIVFAADGMEGNAGEILRDHLGGNVRLIEYPENRGKISVLNDTVPQCNGDIVVFTDVSARFESDAIRKLVEQLIDPEVGGVCGYHRVVNQDGSPAKISGPQRLYWRVDGLVKQAENRLGSISSCYGSIYAIRRELFTPLPSSVTDDAFQAMGIVRQGRRFVFAPEARAEIKPRAKSAVHEVSRRRRVVVRSLRGLWLSRELFNIGKYGLYSVTLFSQKVLRRVIPILLLVMLLASFALAFDSPVWAAIFGLQILLYGAAALSFTGWFDRLSDIRLVRKPVSFATYFVLGQIGTLLGVIDFLRGKRIDRWTPAQG